MFSPAARHFLPDVQVAFASKDVTSRAWYLSVRAKFALAFAFAVAWTGFSVWLSLPWLHDLAGHTGMAFALIAITSPVPRPMRAWPVAGRSAFRSR